MGKAAARCGDTANTCNDPADAPVGTVVAVSTVMIDKMPAAKQNDQIVGVDTDIIMIPAPPGPPIPTPLPHPFAGMIDSACSTSVNIMGMPAATVDSMASAVPPHIPQGGPFQKPPTNKAKIIMGSTSVFIGGGGGGGGGGAGGGETAASSGEEQAVEEGHTFDAWFVDKGGKPIMGVEYEVEDPDGNKASGPLTGQVKKSGVPEGNHKVSLRAITRIEWDSTEAEVGDKVKLKVETVGIESGEIATFVIYMKDANFADVPVKTIETKVESDKIEAEWEFEIDEELLGIQDKRADQGYSMPFFYFYVNVVGLQQRSGLLRYKDWVELEIKDDMDKPAAEAAYVLHLPNGSTRTGTLDKDGYAKEENLPPGRVWVTAEMEEEEEVSDSESEPDEDEDEDKCKVPPLKVLLEETADELGVDPYDFELYLLQPFAVLGSLQESDIELMAGMGLPEEDIKRLKRCLPGAVAEDDDDVEPMTVREYYDFAKRHNLITGSCGETSGLLKRAVLKTGTEPQVLGEESQPADERWITPAALVKTLEAMNRPQWYARVRRNPHSFFIECLNDTTRVYQSYFSKYLLGKCLESVDDKKRDLSDLCGLLEEGIPNQDGGTATEAHRKLFDCPVEWHDEKVTVELIEEPADEAAIRKNLKDLFNENAPTWDEYFTTNGDEPLPIAGSSEPDEEPRQEVGSVLSIRENDGSKFYIEGEFDQDVPISNLVEGQKYACYYEGRQLITVEILKKNVGVVSARVMEG
jgi:uncharacterized Zn-binding protein involved in type VI secretion